MANDEAIRRAEFHWLQEPERILDAEADDAEVCECCGEIFHIDEGAIARFPDYQMEGPTIIRKEWVCYGCLGEETNEFKKCEECGEYFHIDFISEDYGICQECYDKHLDEGYTMRI